MWRRHLQPRQPTGSNPYPTRIEGYGRRSRVTLTSRQGVMKFERTGDGCWDFEGRWEENTGRTRFITAGKRRSSCGPLDYHLTLIKFLSTRGRVVAVPPEDHSPGASSVITRNGNFNIFNLARHRIIPGLPLQKNLRKLAGTVFKSVNGSHQSPMSNLQQKARRC